MLVDVDYAYSVREWGSDTFDVDDPKDEIDIEEFIRDELEGLLGKEAVVTDISIESVKEVKLNV